MATYIHCPDCGKRKREREAEQDPSDYPGEHIQFVKGRAKHLLLCDLCNARLPAGAVCQAMTTYTDESGYWPWEAEALDEVDEPGWPGVDDTELRSRLDEADEHRGKRYSLLLYQENDMGLSARVLEVPDSEVWGTDEAGVIERVIEELDAHLEDEGIPVDGDYSLDVFKVTGEQFGRRCYGGDDSGNE